MDETTRFLTTEWAGEHAVGEIITNRSRANTRLSSRAMQGRITLIVSNRISTVRDVDHIIVFNEGQIVESGTHEELLTQGGIYRRLTELQYTDMVQT